MPWSDELRTKGYSIVEGVFDHDEVLRFIELFQCLDNKPDLRGGRRNLLQIAEIRELARSEKLVKLVHPVLGEGAFPVRGIFFDKHEGANWKVPWHQDVTIAVRQKIDEKGYGPWSIKEGIQHVQPPSHILEGMVSVRLHLDDCLSSNGALRVIEGSHRLGKLDQTLVSNFVENRLIRTCEVNKGGVLLMSPLTIHASSIAEKPHHRRVIHLDYANVQLGGTLEWFEQSFPGETHNHSC